MLFFQFPHGFPCHVHHVPEPVGMEHDASEVPGYHQAALLDFPALEFPKDALSGARFPVVPLPLDEDAFGRAYPEGIAVVVRADERLGLPHELQEILDFGLAGNFRVSETVARTAVDPYVGSENRGGIRHGFVKNIERDLHGNGR